MLKKLRPRYARAGKEHKGKILDQVVQLFRYHRKAALRAMKIKERVSIPRVISARKIEPRHCGLRATFAGSRCEIAAASAAQIESMINAC